MIRDLLQSRFQLLLVALFFLVAVLPFFDSPLVADLIMSTVLVSSLPAVARTKRLRLAGLLLAASSILMVWSSRWRPSPAMIVVAHMLNLGFLALTTSAILARVFATQGDGGARETIAGAVCAYLLIGIMWAHVYCVIETVRPGSFTNAGMPANEAARPEVQLPQFGYFSFITLSTLGYGDIVPVTRQARSLSALEALTGQLYLAILIARLVGQQMDGDGADRRSSSRPAPQRDVSSGAG